MGGITTSNQVTIRDSVRSVPTSDIELLKRWAVTGFGEAFTLMRVR
jgi:hypothetical protein